MNANVPEIKIKAWGPKFAKPNEKFNVQTNGSSSLWFQAEGANNFMCIVAGHNALSTAYKTPDLLTATVDETLFKTPGRYILYLFDTLTGAESRKVIFDVK